MVRRFPAAQKKSSLDPSNPTWKMIIIMDLLCERERLGWSTKHKLRCCFLLLQGANTLLQLTPMHRLLFTQVNMLHACHVKMMTFRQEVKISCGRERERVRERELCVALD